MDSTSSVLTHAIIANAKQAVEDYVTAVSSINEELTGVIAALVANDFNGDASIGYKYFYETKILPAVTDNLTDKESSLSAGIIKILDSIQGQLLDTVDPQLGENNKNPGGAA